MHQVEQFFNEKYLVASFGTKAQTFYAHLRDKKGVKNVIHLGRQNILEPALYHKHIFTLPDQVPWPPQHRNKIHRFI